MKVENIVCLILTQHKTKLQEMLYTDATCEKFCIFEDYRKVFLFL